MAAGNSFQVPIANLRQHSSSFPTVQVEADTNQQKYTATFANAATQRLHGIWYIPGDYTGAAGIRWLNSTRASVNTGNVVFEQKTVIVADNGRVGNAGAETQTANGASAVPGTIGYAKLNAPSPATSVAANRVYAFAYSRLGSDASDTTTGTVTLLDLALDYVNDPTIEKRYAWACAQAMVIPSASGATRSTMLWGATIQPECILLRDSQTDYVEFRYRVPANYIGNMKTTLVESANSATGAFVWRIDAAKVVSGASIDPTFTQGTQFTSAAHANTDTVRVDADRAIPITVSAGDILISRVNRLGSDGSDANTGSAAVWGVMLTFDISTRTPGLVSLDPGCGVAPSSGGCTLEQREGSNVSGFVAKFANGSDQTLDISRLCPTKLAGSVGTLIIEWDSPAASGNAKFRVDYAYIGNNTESADESLTVGTAFVSTTNGANLRNTTTPVTVATSAGPESLLNLRITRLGSDAADTCEAAVYITNIAWVSTPSAP